MQMITRSLVALGIAFAFAVGCGGKGAINQSCDVSGGSNECESGLVCGKPTDSATTLLCLLACKDDNTCGTGTSCKGVEGTNVKACRSK